MLPTAMFAVAGLARRPSLALRSRAGRGGRDGDDRCRHLRPALVSDVPALLALSALALGGMGIGNVVIPPLVKRYFSDRVAMMSTIYITCVQVGTVLPALVAVPVADA